MPTSVVTGNWEDAVSPAAAAELEASWCCGVEEDPFIVTHHYMTSGGGRAEI